MISLPGSPVLDDLPPLHEPPLLHDDHRLLHLHLTSLHDLHHPVLLNLDTSVHSSPSVSIYPHHLSHCCHIVSIAMLSAMLGSWRAIWYFHPPQSTAESIKCTEIYTAALYCCFTSQANIHICIMSLSCITDWLRSRRVQSVVKTYCVILPAAPDTETCTFTTIQNLLKWLLDFYLIDTTQTCWLNVQL